MTIQEGDAPRLEGAVVNRFCEDDFIIAVGEDSSDSHDGYPSDFTEESVAFLRLSVFNLLTFDFRGDYPIPMQSSHSEELSRRMRSVSPSIIPPMSRKIKHRKRTNSVIDFQFNTRIIFVIFSCLLMSIRLKRYC